MMAIPPLAIVACFFAIALGLPLSLYALLTRGQRRNMRAIRQGATERGWRYRVRHWQGNPTAFRIDGQTRSGLVWILTSGSISGYDRGCNVRLALRLPTLGGEADFAIFPREAGGSRSPLLSANIRAAMVSRVARVSRSAATAIGFFCDAREFPSGVAAFDAAYQVLSLRPETGKSPIDVSLAERVLHWPADAVPPHSLLAWRDSFAFHIQARLPGPPNWATVSHFIAFSEDLIARIPSPVASTAPRGLVDRMVARCFR